MGSFFFGLASAVGLGAAIDLLLGWERDDFQGVQVPVGSKLAKSGSASLRLHMQSTACRHG